MSWRDDDVCRLASAVLIGYTGVMITLFDDVFSPYARKVRIALYEKDALTNP